VTRPVVLGGLAAGGVALAIALVCSSPLGGPGPTVPTLEVRSAPFRVRITAEGNLAAVRNTPLTAPMKPQRPFTLAWLVEDGAFVEEGEIIARFDASQLEKDREDGLSDQRISDYRIDSAQTSRKVNVGKLNRDAVVAGKELEVAREFQSTDNLVYSKMEIVESQIDTELAETRADHARNSQNPVRVGDAVWPGRPLAKIPDLTEMQAEVYVLEADAGDLEDGQRAVVWLEADPNVAHTATLKSIDPMAGRRNRRVPVQYFRTVLALEKTDTDRMKPGSRVHAEITIADLDSTITVPRQAVCNVEGKAVVYRWERGRFNAAEIELGPAAVGRVVVTAGLEDGDLIALRDPTDTETEKNGMDSSSSPILPGGAS